MAVPDLQQRHPGGEVSHRHVAQGDRTGPDVETDAVLGLGPGTLHAQRLQRPGLARDGGARRRTADDRPRSVSVHVHGRPRPGLVRQQGDRPGDQVDTLGEVDVTARPCPSRGGLDCLSVIGHAVTHGADVSHRDHQRHHGTPFGIHRDRLHSAAQRRRRAYRQASPQPASSRPTPGANPRDRLTTIRSRGRR
ncbi:Uncharacterised protein [Mycobacteroides abscessus subsp. abscessus]|nr:Uncharacterised protein [Mycobacteroides abscessus subsp. abscessus]